MRYSIKIICLNLYFSFNMFLFIIIFIILLVKNIIVNNGKLDLKTLTPTEIIINNIFIKDFLFLLIRAKYRFEIVISNIKIVCFNMLSPTCFFEKIMWI